MTGSATQAPAPGLVQRVWPGPSAPVRGATLAAAGTAGAVAALLLPDQPPPGAGLVAVGGLAGAAVLLQRRLAWSAPELGLAALAGGLLTVAAVRDAEWLVALCLLAGVGLGALAVSSARSWTATLLTPAATAVAVLRALPWVAGGTSPVRGTLRRWGARVRTAAVTALLLGIFGALLTSADAAFARLVELALPDLRLGELPGRLVLGAVVASGALGAAYLSVAPPRWALVQVPPGRAARRAEWLVPVGALDLLLLSFLVVHSTVLFGGRDHVLRTTGLTWAEYARSGFSQLLAVTALVLLVVAAAVRWAPRSQPGDALVVRAALGLLLGLTLAVAGSALVRLHLYEQAYGATRARLLAAAVELWLVVVLLLVAWTGARRPDSGGSAPPRIPLPAAVAATAGLALLALAALDADALVARRNVDRHLAGVAGSPLDTSYLSRLSADAVLELDRLPEPQRSCALAPIARRLTASADSGWGGANLARRSARALLAERPVQQAPPAALCAVRSPA